MPEIVFDVRDYEDPRAWWKEAQLGRDGLGRALEGHKTPVIFGCAVHAVEPGCDVSDADLRSMGLCRSSMCRFDIQKKFSVLKGAAQARAENVIEQQTI